MFFLLCHSSISMSFRMGFATCLKLIHPPSSLKEIIYEHVSFAKNGVMQKSFADLCPQFRCIIAKFHLLYALTAVRISELTDQRILTGLL